MADRWVETTGYEFTKSDGKWVILQRGGKHLAAGVRDDEMALTVIGGAASYDSVLKIVKALRLTLSPVAEGAEDRGQTDG